jgi:hypothetical protein
MMTYPQAVKALADRVGCADGPEVQRRHSLEESLVPVVRCALRTGRGHPRLLSWVRRALASVPGPHQCGRPVDPDRTAAPLARLLCSTLLEQVRSAPGRAGALETVMGC